MSESAGAAAETEGVETALPFTLLSLPEPTPLPEERTLRTDANTAGFLYSKSKKHTSSHYHESFSERCVITQILLGQVMKRRQPGCLCLLRARPPQCRNIIWSFTRD